MIEFIVIFLVLLLFGVMSNMVESEPSDNDRAGQAYRGKYFVLYPDGFRSERMNLSVARSYRSIFGGTIYPVTDITHPPKEKPL